MKKILLTNILMLTVLCLNAQTDITKYYLANYGFDENFDYPASSSKSVAEEILPVDGWTANLSATYTIVGTYEFGFKGKFNSGASTPGSVPATGYDGEAGGGLAISTGWEQTFLFYQTITLPAGTYTLKVPTYNGCTVSTATSQVAWIPNSGTAKRSTKTSYTANSWTLDQITFTLTKTTTGKIQFGMKAAAGGSVNSAKLVIDYVQLLGENMSVDKSSLSTTLTSANKYYGDGTGNEAAALKSAIDTAQGIYNDANVDMITVLEANIVLNAAIDAYRKENVSEENPLDKTEYITNPSFENTTNGWTVENLSTQTNSSFSKKAGSTYMEKWVSSGSVGSASAIQTIKNLPKGKYKLTVAAQNYTESSTTKKNTGAYIYADDQQTTVYTPNNYSVTFTSISGEAEIGFVAVNATGNWLALDNFRLYLIGYMSTEEVMAEIQRLVNEAKALQASMMSAKAATTLQSAINAGEAITPTSEETDVQTATKTLHAALKTAKESIAEYQVLEQKITEVENSYDETKEGAADLKAAIDNAKELHQNAEATSAALAAEIVTLDKALLAFHLANATPGTGTAPKVTSTNHYVATGATQALVRATMTGSNILERGVCWSTEHEPTVLDNRTTDHFSLKGYIFHLSGLKPATVYYIRPYVMNKTYTVAYGDEVKIVTISKGTCTWSWNNGAPDEAANARCRKAMEETIEYFNEWTGIKGFHLTGSYGAQTPTADCSYGGNMRIGPSASYQAIGTVLHETGHGVGVGQHVRWTNCAETRESTTYGKWLGREANDVLHFLENNYNSEEVYFTGDGVHGWGWGSNSGSNISYDWLVNGADKDKHIAIQYIGGMCIMRGLFVDGLDPTSGGYWYAEHNGIASYTYNFDDDKKYYLMCKDTNHGLGEGLLYQRASTAVGWKPCLTGEVVQDSAAWYMEFVPTTGYYRFKNVASGKYLTHSTSSSLVALKSTSSPGATENFQLMPDRTDVSFSIDGKNFNTHGYWFTWTPSSSTFKSMSAKDLSEELGYGSIAQANFNYANSATAQQWIILSEDELAAYQEKAIATGVQSIAVSDKTPNGKKSVMGIYTTGGVQLKETQPGFNIIKYSDGTTKKIFVK